MDSFFVKNCPNHCFEELLKIIESLSEEDSRAVREGLTEEYLAIFDLLCQQKNNLSAGSRNRVKEISNCSTQRE